MKRLIPTYVSVCLVVLMLSCSAEDNTETYDAEANAVLLKEQLPTRAFDQSPNGLYHGAVLSASTQARGKIWVNIGNNGLHNALIELADGSIYTFTPSPEFMTANAVRTVFNYIGSAGSFVVDVSDINNPQLSELNLGNEAFFGQLVKSLSASPASVATAVFSEFGSGSFSGTWSFIADGSIVNPNGDNGVGISSLMIVYNGEVFTDSSFDAFDASSCLNNSNYVPTLNGFGVNGSVISDYQNSEFAGGTTKWDLSYDASSGSYMDYRNCSGMGSGIFSWTSGDGLVMVNGEIMLD